MNMSTADSCNECAAILDELRNVAGYSGTPEQLRKRLGATLPVILSADDDALEELLQKHPFRLMARDADGTPLQPSARPSKYQAVFRRLWTHRARTGHWPLPFR